MRAAVAEVPLRQDQVTSVGVGMLDVREVCVSLGYLMKFVEVQFLIYK